MGVSCVDRTGVVLLFVISYMQVLGKEIGTISRV